MLNDLIVLDESIFGARGTLKMNVAANTSGQGTGTSYVKAFRPGEIVGQAVSGVVAVPLYTTAESGNTKPVVGTDFIAGVAASISTETASAAGTVEVIPVDSNVVWLIDPKVAATWDTQAEYDALVNKRVLIDLVSGYATGKYSILASDSSTSGCSIAPLDVAKYPGKVAFRFRAALSIVA